jgi:hypothetical protein
MLKSILFKIENSNTYFNILIIEVKKLKEITLDFVEVNTEIANKINLTREIEVSKIPSPVLARLIEEVRNEEIYSINAYNRMHNRHNRSR